MNITNAKPVEARSTAAPNPSANRFPIRYCRALGWIEYRGRLRPVFPLTALVYAAIGAGVILASLCLAEWRLEHQSRSLPHNSQVSSPEWSAENETINAMNWAKLRELSPEMPLWHSQAFPVDLTRKQPAEHRVLVVGDSFVWGDGYANMNDIWWRQLQRELNRRGYWHVQVLGIGSRAASTQDELSWLRQWNVVSRFQPDILVWGYVSNDADTVDENHRHRVKQLQPPNEPILQSALESASLGELYTLTRSLFPVLVYQLDERLVRAWERNTAARSGAYPYAEWEFKLLEGENWEAYRNVLGEVAAFVRDARIPCFFLTLPNQPNDSYFRPLHRKVAPLFQQAGLQFHDVLDAFVAEYPRQSNVTSWGINPANGHPGTCSTHFFAVQAANVLEKEYPEVLGPRGPAPSLAPTLNDWMPPSMQVTRLAANEWQVALPPGATDQMLFMPMRERHLLLCFEHPVAMQNLQLVFTSECTADAWVTTIDKDLGYDTGSLIPLGRQTGVNPSWALTREGQPLERVNTLRIAGSFLGTSSATGFKLNIRFADPAVQP